MENVKSNSGRKKLSDEIRRTHEFTIMLNDEEYEHLCSLRNRFGSRYSASRFRAFLENSYNQHF